MENQTQNQNQQLTVKQQKLLEAIAKVGVLPEVSFVRKTAEFRKIRTLEQPEITEGLGIIFVRAVNLLGIREKISQINKKDIWDMILTKFKNLSLEEIEYAFRLDRWSGDPTPHFQLFNAEYVAKVLKKYTDWLRHTRVSSRLSIEQDEKEELIHTRSGRDAINCFEEFKATGMIEPGNNHVYDWLHKHGKFPEHTAEFKERIVKKAVKGKEAMGKNQLNSLCKDLVLKEYFNKLMSEGKSIKNEIPKYQSANRSTYLVNNSIKLKPGML